MVPNTETWCLIGWRTAGDGMSGKKARVRQKEIQLIVRGAMKAGAKQVTVRLGDAFVDVHLAPDDKPAAADADEEIKL